MALENEAYILTVSDNGVGLPAKLDVKHPKILGLKLVNQLAGQLHGKLEVESDANGSARVIKFPKQVV